MKLIRHARFKFWVVGFIVCGLLSLDIFPDRWLYLLPRWVQLAVFVFWLFNAMFMVLGFICDSGLIQRIRRNKD